jgi:hypothetical protein
LLFDSQCGVGKLKLASPEIDGEAAMEAKRLLAALSKIQKNT